MGKTIENIFNKWENAKAMARKTRDARFEQRMELALKYLVQSWSELTDSITLLATTNAVLTTKLGELTETMRANFK